MLPGPSDAQQGISAACASGVVMIARKGGEGGEQKTAFEQLFGAGNLLGEACLCDQTWTHFAHTCPCLTLHEVQRMPGNKYMRKPGKVVKDDQTVCHDLHKVSSMRVPLTLQNAGMMNGGYQQQIVTCSVCSLFRKPANLWGPI